MGKRPTKTVIQVAVCRLNADIKRFGSGEDILCHGIEVGNFDSQTLVKLCRHYAFRYHALQDKMCQMENSYIEAMGSIFDWDAGDTNV